MSDNNIYPFSSLVGGINDSYLDFTNGASLIDGDFAFGVSDGIQYTYRLDAYSGATENSPYVISPDNNAGDKRWILMVPGGAFSHVRANHQVGSIIATSVITSVVFEQEKHDTLGEYDHTTGIFTAKCTGYYIVNVTIHWGSQSWGSGNRCRIYIFKNTTLLKYSIDELQGGGTFYVHQEANITIPLSVGDVIKVSINQDSGSNKSLYPSPSASMLTIDRLS